jgi:hypothetical protein
MTNIQRRYSPSKPEYKIYSDYFDRYLIASTVLNSGERGAIIVQNLSISDLSALKHALFELEGDALGVYETTKAAGAVRAAIPATELKLSQIHERFSAYCYNKEAQGYKKPEVWPPNLLKERLHAEARFDVLRREAEVLHNLIDNYKEKEVAADASKVLQYGPRGNGQLRDGTLESIDDQKVDFTADDILIISDDNSPYNGMRVADYREFVVMPCKAAQNKRIKELHDKQVAELRATGHSNVVIPSYGLRKVSRESLPKWPDGVKNYLLPEERVTMVRKNKQSSE